MFSGDIVLSVKEFKNTLSLLLLLFPFPAQIFEFSRLSLTMGCGASAAIFSRDEDPILPATIDSTGTASRLSSGGSHPADFADTVKLANCSFCTTTLEVLSVPHLEFIAVPTLGLPYRGELISTPSKASSCRSSATIIDLDAPHDHNASRPDDVDDLVEMFTNDSFGRGPLVENNAASTIAVFERRVDGSLDSQVPLLYISNENEARSASWYSRQTSEQRMASPPHTPPSSKA